MSHHLDSPLSRQDVRLNITDLYVFRGTMGTAFVLNVNNSIAGADAPRDFHPEAQYAIKIDLDGDAVEDLAYRLTFGESDAAGTQTVDLRRLAGREANDPTALGALVAQGATDRIIEGVGGMRLWAGRVPDPFYIDPTVLKAVGAAFKDGTRVDLSVWQAEKATNLFDGTTVNAIVLEVPDAELTWRLREVPSAASDASEGERTRRLRVDKQMNVWATTMLATDAGGWHPINRAGRPMMQPIFSPADSHEASHYNISLPADDLANYGERYAKAVADVVCAHGTSANPQAYGELVAAQLLPDMLPYQIGTSACYGFAGQNGRALTDNVPDVMFSLVTNSALPTGLSRQATAGTLREEFPYVGATGPQPQKQTKSKAQAARGTSTNAVSRSAKK